MIAIFDIDHTLSDASWRDHLMGEPWDKYHRESVNDNPIMQIIAIAKSLRSDGWKIIAMTTREEKWRYITICTLNLFEFHFDMILMRPDNDKRPTPIVKMDQFRQTFFLDQFPNIVIFDDRLDVIEAFREIGVTALQVFAGGKRNVKNIPN